MTTWRGKAIAGAVVVAAIAVPSVVAQVATSDSAQQSYENQVAACERGNPLRGVVFRNTQISVQQSRGIKDPDEITKVFRANLKALRSVPGVDPKTGYVDCLEVIERP